MDSGVIDLAINIAAGLLTAIALWFVQWSLRRRRINRTREFFGLAPDAECLLVVNRHAASTSDHSVHRRDVFALLELAGLIKQCGARAEVVGHDEVRRGFGERAEFSIGGPGSNTRTAAHLEWKLPGVAFPRQSDPRSMTINVGDDVYRREAGVAEYVLFAKITGAEQGRPVFLICGQTAVTNQAAVRYLVAHERKLARKYGTKKSFCVMLKVINPEAYGPDVVEWVGDVTDKAFNPKQSADAKSPVETGGPAAKSSAKPASEAAAKPTGEAGKSAGEAIKSTDSKPAAVKATATKATASKAAKAPAKAAAKPATSPATKSAAASPATAPAKPATSPPAGTTNPPAGTTNPADRSAINPPTELRPAAAPPGTRPGQPGSAGASPGTRPGQPGSATASPGTGAARPTSGNRDTQ